MTYSSLIKSAIKSGNNYTMFRCYRYQKPKTSRSHYSLKSLVRELAFSASYPFSWPSTCVA